MNAKKEDDDMSNSIKCMKCGFENLANVKFCGIMVQARSVRTLEY